MEGETQNAQLVLREMAESGFEATELGDWGFLPTDPHELAEVLTQTDLQLVGAFVPVALAAPKAHAGGLEVALKTAKLLESVGTDAVIVLADENGTDPIRTARAGRIGRDDGLPSDRWDSFVGGANQIARAVRDATGLQTVFHHHCAGYVETPSEIDYLLTHTEPDLLGLCLDTGHYAFGGGDPLEALQRYGDRVRHVHFKDFSPEIAREARRQGWDYFQSIREGVFCELGKGNVDFPAITNHLQAVDYKGWVVVEQDILPGMGSGLDNAIKNRSYLRSMGL